MKICSFDGCGKRAICKGLCAGHYWQVRRGEELRPLQVQYQGLPPKARFLKRVEGFGEKGCWNWTGAKVRGYGEWYNENGNMELAHRAAYRMFVADLPPQTFVCHKCDNPACVNPDHLFLGDHTDNMRDMWAKGRARPGRQNGEKHGNAKLTDAAVKDMRSSSEAGVVLAQKYGVTRTTISDIRRRRIWKHI